MYVASKPSAPWINTIISHQIKNLIRNNYGNYSRPCLRCAASEGDNLCSIYTTQCNDCPLYSYWEKHKKQAHNIKLPLPIENHSQEVFNQTADFIDVEKTAINIHNYMQKILRPIELKIYNYVAHRVRAALVGGRFEAVVALWREEWEARGKGAPEAARRIAGIARDAGGAVRPCGGRGGTVLAAWAPPGERGPGRREALLEAARAAGLRLFPARVDLLGLDLG